MTSAAGPAGGAPRTSAALYANQGNQALLALLPAGSRRILDVGCGAGDNARLLTQRGCYVVGITMSEAEASIASAHCARVVLGDIEGELPQLGEAFDALLLSHVLEHLKNPAGALCRLSRLLVHDGSAVIAVPNMAHWRLRWRFLRGDWRREDTGPLDRTHLQFWSYETAPSLLETTPFELERRAAGGPSVPLWPLRRLGPSLCGPIDRTVGGLLPNLFATQVLLVGRRIR